MTAKEEKYIKEKMLKDAEAKVEEKGNKQKYKMVDQKEKEAEGKDKRTWLQKLKKELKPDVKLIPLKIFAFLFYGGMFSITPFYSLHMQQLGISVEEIAVIYTLLPIPAILGPLISGILADWTSNFKAVLVGNIVLTLLTNLATTLTPTLRPTAPHSPVAFNSSGLALASVDCFNGGGLTDTQQWWCSSDCFSTDAFSPYLNTTHSIRCSGFEPHQEIPLEGCIVPTASDPDCGHGLSFLPQEKDVASLELQNTSLHYTDQQCSMTCNKTAITTSAENTGFSNSRTFWIYFIVRFLSNLFLRGAFRMMDASIMAVILKSGGDYGKQRLVAMLSLATFPFIASCLVIQTEVGPDYTPLFYLMTGLLCGSVGVAYFIDIQVDSGKEKTQKMCVNIMELFKSMEVNVFMLVLFLLGANWGFLENYLFVYLKSLKAPTYMLGLTLTFGCLTGVPMLLLSDRIVEKLGRSMIFFIAFLAYTVRMFGYSFITNPWYCFIFEALEMFTFQIMWVAVVTYFPILAPTSLLGTLSGIAGAMHYNIGRGGGAFFGGFLISHIGMVWTFRAFGVASFVFGFLYFAIQKLYLNKAFAEKAAAAADKKERLASSTEPV